MTIVVLERIVIATVFFGVHLNEKKRLELSNVPGEIPVIKRLIIRTTK